MWAQTLPQLMALSLMGGILCGALWDVLKLPAVLLLGENQKGKAIFIISEFVSDFVFCITCGCVFLVALYYGNSGNLRGAAVLCMAAGFAAYRVSFGKLTRAVALKIRMTTIRVWQKLLLLIKKVVKTVKKHRKEKIKEE